MDYFNFPLSRAEQIMKEIYLNNKELISKPFKNDEVRKWPCASDIVNVSDYEFNDFGIERYFNELVNEKPQYNAWIKDHPRYFPAVLHKMSFIKIIYVHHGQANIYIKDSHFTLSEGDVCFIAPKTLHSVSVFMDDVLVLNCLLKQSVLQDCFSVLLKREDVLSQFFFTSMYEESVAPAIIFHANGDAEIKSYFEKLYTEYLTEYDYYTYNIIEAILMMLFGLLLRKHGSDMTVINDIHVSEDENIVECIKYLHANYATISLSELAHKFHYSSSYLSRVMKQYTGVSFLQYTKKRKLDTAFSMLEQSEIPIKEIAANAGFSDSSSFYRSFKNYFGITPLECRKNAVKKAAAFK